MLYHKKYGFPESLIIPKILVNLKYSRHAIERKNKTYKLKKIPDSILIKPESVIEVKTTDNITPQKVLIRTSYNKKEDLILVIQLLKKGARVVTLWLNHKKDNHKTCIKKYDKPCKEN